MNLLYVCTYDLTIPAALGVAKKMKAQRKVFSDNFKVSYTFIKDGYFYLSDDTTEINLGKLHFPGRINAYALLMEYYQKKGNVPEKIYIRYTMSDWNVIRFVDYMHRYGSNIIVEIPTYPYEMECKDNLFDYISLTFDRMYRNKLKKGVSYIASYGDIPESLYGIKTIRLQNGIDFDTIVPRKYEPHGDTINLIAVAKLAKWHGYDRILRGMTEYYAGGGTRDIHFDIVGDGEVMPEYRELVKKGNLEKRVQFWGFQTGAKLDALFDGCDIAVACLACHRKGIYGSISDLKSREYAARGIPMITSTEIDVFPSAEYDFVMKVPEDDSAVDVENIIEFHKKILKTVKSGDYITDIARQICDIKETMHNLLEKF